MGPQGAGLPAERRDWPGAAADGGGGGSVPWYRACGVRSGVHRRQFFCRGDCASAPACRGQVLRDVRRDDTRRQGHRPIRAGVSGVGAVPWAGDDGVPCGATRQPPAVRAAARLPPGPRLRRLSAGRGCRRSRSGQGPRLFSRRALLRRRPHQYHILERHHRRAEGHSLGAHGAPAMRVRRLCANGRAPARRVVLADQPRVDDGAVADIRGAIELRVRGRV
mmetsp:Transcript_7310/g.13866  ORF Transcript_7310/g.13866 Transcript_7310/m.13866 type:complete len:221 (-) Transcript_7310:1218-1880(-)